MRREGDREREVVILHIEGWINMLGDVGKVDCAQISRCNHDCKSVVQR